MRQAIYEASGERTPYLDYDTEWRKKLAGGRSGRCGSSDRELLHRPKSFLKKFFLLLEKSGLVCYNMTGKTIWSYIVWRKHGIFGTGKQKNQRGIDCTG